jgi:hypothetical protein
LARHPLAVWPAAQPGTTAAFSPPRGRGIQAIPEGTPFTWWLPIQPGLTSHGLRHSHKTWMAEDGGLDRVIQSHPEDDLPNSSQLIKEEQHVRQTISGLTRSWPI